MTDNSMDRTAAQTARPPKSLSGLLIGGTLSAIVMFGGITAWATMTKIDGAVIAQGSIVVESDRKIVQHFEGGVVADVLVREGAYVAKGDPLIRLDVTQAQSELAAVQDRLTGLELRKIRLETELQDGGSLQLPKSLLPRLQDQKFTEIADNEQGLFASRRAMKVASADLLHRRIASLQARMDGQNQQKLASQEELALLAEQMEKTQTLLARKLVQGSVVLDLKRDMSQLRSAIATNTAEMDGLGAQIREIEAELRQSKAAGRSDAAEELATTQRDIHALQEQAVVLQDRLSRTMILAPQSGKILNLTVNVRGAVIAPGAAVMELVPVDDKLILSARIPAGDIERVQVGQETRIRLTAFNQNATPELLGQVTEISADALFDEDSGFAFYTGRIVLAEDPSSAKARAALVPGMPAEVLISTGERLASSYFMRPLKDAYARTFRDD